MSALRNRITRLAEGLRGRGRVFVFAQLPGETEEQATARLPQGRAHEYDTLILIRRFTPVPKTEGFDA